MEENFSKSLFLGGRDSPAYLVVCVLKSDHLSGIQMLRGLFSEQDIDLKVHRGQASDSLFREKELQLTMACIFSVVSSVLSRYLPQFSSNKAAMSIFGPEKSSR